MGGLFSDKVLSIPKLENSALDLILKSTWQNIKRLGTASLTTFALLQLAQFSVVTSNLQGLAILYQDRAIVREWRSLLQIDTTVSQLAYHLGKTVNILSPLSDISRVQKVFLAYQEKGLFQGVTESTNNVSYLALLREMARINAVMKDFIAANSTDVLEDYKAGAGVGGFTFTTEFIDQLDEDYSAVRSFSPCNATFSALQSTIKNGFAANASAAKDSWSIISNAAKRLSDAFSKTFSSSKKKSTLADQYFSERELQMLGTMYGLDTSKMTNRDVPRWKRLIGLTPSAKSELTAIKGKVSSLIDQTVSAIAQMKSKKEGKKTEREKTEAEKKAEEEKAEKRKTEAEKKAEEDRNMIDEYKKKLGNPSSILEFSHVELLQLFKMMESDYNENFDGNLAVSVGSTFSGVYALYFQSSQDFTAAETTSWSSIFYTLVDQITKIEKEIEDKTGLLSVIGEICEKQCTNKGNKGCRPI